MNGTRTPALLLAWGLALGAITLGTAAETEPSGLDFARRLNQAFVAVAEQVSPSVVVIRVARKPDLDALLPDAHPFLELPPEKLQKFQEELESLRRERQRRGPEFDDEGSGFILRHDGYLLTNSHVVERAEKISVRLQSGREFQDVRVVGVDPQSDVAVLKIEARGLPAARLGDSAKTRVGEFAIAIGAPFTLDYSVTFGHISGKGRRILATQQMWDQDFLQTDASINPGNSGGPLVNIDGEVVGINTLIRGMNSGIGFAVPINLAQAVAEQIIREGRVSRPVLGIEIRTLRLSPELQGALTMATDGVVVRRILPWSPVADSELQAGDVILAVDGRAVATAEQLQAEVRTKPIGQPVTLDVVRGRQPLKVQVRPGELPDAPPRVTAAPRGADRIESRGFGLKVDPLSEELARRVGVAGTAGVVVQEVAPDSAAADSGIEPGDVITHVDRKKVTGVAGFRDALRSADLKKGVLLHLVNGEGRRFEVLKEKGE